MKYDFDLDMNTENSLSIILKSIKPNSVVLEFGPATGRMTKYLKQNLNCKVYIVEIDEEAARKAIQYAVDGITEDIENYGWAERFKDIKFDYICFADVLEHLRFPDRVLKSCKQLLANDGSIFVSIPNIAHNSVVLNLLNNKFEYTNVGLLDNTHIKFFTYESLLNMISTCDLVATTQKTVNLKVGENEINNSYEDINKYIMSAIKNRKYADVYQFVFELKKKEYVNEKNICTYKDIKEFVPNYFIQVYIDDGNGFSESKSIIKNFSLNYTKFEFDLRNYPTIKNIRIDPSNSNCVININKISLIDNNNNEVLINNIVTNSEFNFNNTYIYKDIDPQIYISTNETKFCKLIVDIDFFNIEYLEKEYNYHIYNMLKSKQHENDNLESLNEQLQAKSRELFEENQRLNKTNNELVKLNQNMKKEIDDLNKNRLVAMLKKLNKLSR